MTSETTTLQANFITTGTLNYNDVLCGRGSGPNDHIGNVKFRKLVLSRKAEYLSTNMRRRKAQIAEEIVSTVQNKEPRGRFLKRVDASVLLDSGFDPDFEAWCLVVDDVALEKAKQALRQNRDRHLVEDEIRQKQQKIQCQKQRESTYHQDEYPIKTDNGGSGEIVNAPGSCPQPVCTKDLHHITKRGKCLMGPYDHRNTLPYGLMTPNEFLDISPSSSDTPHGASGMSLSTSWKINATRQTFPIEQPKITTDGIEIELQGNAAKWKYQMTRIQQSQKYTHHYNWQHQEQFPFAFGNQGTFKKSTGEVINPASYSQLMPDPSGHESRRQNLPEHTTCSVFKEGSLKREEFPPQEQTKRQRIYQEQTRCVPNSKIPICSESCDPYQCGSDMLRTTMTLAGMSDISMSMSFLDIDNKKDMSWRT